LEREKRERERRKPMVTHLLQALATREKREKGGRKEGESREKGGRKEGERREKGGRKEGNQPGLAAPGELHM
jgi:hypothetical protein